MGGPVHLPEKRNRFDQPLRILLMSPVSEEVLERKRLRFLGLVSLTALVEISGTGRTVLCRLIRG